MKIPFLLLVFLFLCPAFAKANKAAPKAIPFTSVMDKNVVAKTR
jgi:hypothetical protein